MSLLESQVLGRKNAQIPTKSCGSIKLTFTPTMMMLYCVGMMRKVCFVVCILTKAGALSIRSDSRGNNHHYSEGVSHLLTPIKFQKGCPLSLGDRLNPVNPLRSYLPFRIPKRRFKFSKNLEKPHFTLLNTCINWRTQKSTLSELALP